MLKYIYACMLFIYPSLVFSEHDSMEEAKTFFTQHKTEILSVYEGTVRFENTIKFTVFNGDCKRHDVVTKQKVPCDSGNLSEQVEKLYLIGVKLGRFGGGEFSLSISGAQDENGYIDFELVRMQRPADTPACDGKISVGICYSEVDDGWQIFQTYIAFE